MCLLKRDDQQNSCNHDSCKSFYVNKSMCMYTTANAFVQPRNIKPAPTLNEDPNFLDHLQKKLKTDSEGSMRSAESEPHSFHPQTYQQLNLSGYQPMLNNEGMTPIILNPYIQPKPNITATSVSNPMYIPIMPKTVFSAQSNPEQFISQGAVAYSPLLKPKQPATIICRGNNTPLMDMDQIGEKSAKQEYMGPSSNNQASNQNADAVMKEFQSKLFGLLLTQNKMLVDLKERNEVTQDTLACLITEVTALKSAVRSTTPDKVFGAVKYTSQAVGNSSESVTTESLLNCLYGPNYDFQYSLVLKTELSLPLYRERNFKFTVMLVDKEGNIVENVNYIRLTIGIYSSENPPKYIDTNTSGNKILKGFTEKDLVNGCATFEKIQIKEVTSHFRNGWVFLAVYPCTTSRGMCLISNAKVVPINKIKPLIIEKVVVKAKKTKGLKDILDDPEEVETNAEQESKGSEETKPNNSEKESKENVEKDSKENGA